jgi:hypothetical protein
MKICTKCNKSKQLIDFNKNKNRKDGVQIWCKSCYNMYCTENKEKLSRKRAIYTEEHKKEKVLYDSIRYQDNKEEVSKYNEKYRSRHKEEISIYSKEYRTRNKETQYFLTSEWKKSNPGKVAASNAKRRAAKLNATLKSLSKEQNEEMTALYVEAARLTRETGIQYHVDHIVPLQGDNVSGLHVPWNLQIMIAYGPDGNCSKGNRLI